MKQYAQRALRRGLLSRLRGAREGGVQPLSLDVLYAAWIRSRHRSAAQGKTVSRNPTRRVFGPIAGATRPIRCIGGPHHSFPPPPPDCRTPGRPIARVGRCRSQLRRRRGHLIHFAGAAALVFLLRFSIQNGGRVRAAGLVADVRDLRLGAGSPSVPIFTPARPRFTALRVALALSQPRVTLTRGGACAHGAAQNAARLLADAARVLRERRAAHG